MNYNELLDAALERVNRQIDTRVNHELKMLEYEWEEIKWKNAFWRMCGVVW